jgi:replicative DNA helicase
LKTIARELEIPVLALSQISRSVDRRAEKMALLSDMSDSGSIEEIADKVLFLHRPDYYDANDQPGLAELHVLKNRNGCTGVVRLVFQRNLTRFDNHSLAEPFDEKSPY